MASTYSSSTEAARKSWEKKKPPPTLIETVKDLVGQYALPVAVGAFLVRRFLAYRKQQAAKKEPLAKDSEAKPAAHRRTVRREYKVKRDEDPGPMLVGADDEEEEEGVEVQPHDNVMEAYNEQDVEKAGAAASGPGGGNTAMLQMLQQMGYRIVMPKDGNGQVFLVPPGAKGPGGQAIEEGDEEGYDEDEEGYEEGEEEGDD